MRLKTNGARTKKSNHKRSGTTDWDKLRRVSPATIRKGIAADPDAHSTDEEFWKSAKVVMPAPKEIVTMRLDSDLLRWFRQQRGYQTRINAILRAYMHAHESL
ncbi:MAG: BrnA antitoxin family protein [Candidatus Sulfotelmatobacter sp.]